MHVAIYLIWYKVTVMGVPNKDLTVITVSMTVYIYGCACSVAFNGRLKWNWQLEFKFHPML